MKKILLSTLVLAALLTTKSTDAQVRLHIDIGPRVPVYCAPVLPPPPPPVVVYDYPGRYRNMHREDVVYDERYNRAINREIGGRVYREDERFRYGRDDFRPRDRDRRDDRHFDNRRDDDHSHRY